VRELSPIWSVILSTTGSDSYIAVDEAVWEADCFLRMEFSPPPHCIYVSHMQGLASLTYCYQHNSAR